MSFKSFFTTVPVTLFTLILCVVAEQHTIKFDNQCGFGTPQLIHSGNILSSGEDFTSNGAFSSGIAYLQTGKCLLNGEGCTLVEMTLNNPTCPGCGSSSDLSLIPPLAFSVPTSFSYFGGCDGQGATCTTKDCSTAFFVPDDNQVQVACQDNNVNLLITFCPGGQGAAVKQQAAVASTSAATASASTAAASTSTAAASTSVVAHATSSSSSVAPSSTSKTSKVCGRNHTARRSAARRDNAAHVPRAHRMHKRAASVAL